MSLSSAQLQRRRASLGGSDAAIAVNLSPWKSPYRLWLEKLGEVSDDDRENMEAKYFGNVLEDIVAVEFQRRTGKRVARVRRTLTHPHHHWMTGNIDRRILGEREGLECKTASPYSAKQWGERDDQIPLQYLIQVMHYMAVTGWRAWHVAVLIGGNDFRRFRIERDDEMIADLIEREREFWDCVEGRTPPPLTNIDDAALRWPRDYGAPIVASPNARRAYDRLCERRAQMRELEKQMDADGLIIRQWMGEHTTLLDVDGSTRLASWKTQRSRRIDLDKLREQHAAIAAALTHEQETRVFRLNEPKN